MTNNFDNPYETSTTGDGSPAPFPADQVYRYTELPRSCPTCERKFSEAFFHRLYRRRFRFGTVAFFVFLAIGGYAFMMFVGWLVLLAAIPLGSWAMTWNKKVRMRCVSCGWRQKYIVSARG